MKKTAAALAAIVLLSGTALAKDPTDAATGQTKIAPPADTIIVRSVHESTHDATAPAPSDTKIGSKLGISINPFFLPTQY